MAATTKTWVNGVPPTCEDVDLNGFKTENNNLITGAGISLSTADNQQTHKAVAHYAGVGDFYVDSGVANAYVLSVTGVQVAPPTYATGMRIRFRPGNANTGASTVNVDGLGVKALVLDETGGALEGEEIGANSELRAYYDGVSFRVTTPAVVRSVVRAILTGTSQTITASTTTIVNLTAATGSNIADTRGEFTAGASARFIPKTAGYYRISAKLAWTSFTVPAGTPQITMTLRKNGSSVISSDRISWNAASPVIGFTSKITDIVFLDGVADYVDITAFHSVTGAPNVILNGGSSGSNSSFAAEKI